MLESLGQTTQFLKERKNFLIFVMFTLAWIVCQYNRCSLLLLDLSICLGSMVIKLDMKSKKSPIIWKINLSRKVSIISGMRVKNCQKKCLKNQFSEQSSGIVLKKQCVGGSFLLCLKRDSGIVVSYKFCEFSGRLLLSIAIICQEHFKLNVRIMTYLLLI